MRQPEQSPGHRTEHPQRPVERGQEQFQHPPGTPSHDDRRDKLFAHKHKRDQRQQQQSDGLRRRDADQPSQDDRRGSKQQPAKQPRRHIQPQRVLEVDRQGPVLYVALHVQTLGETHHGAECGLDGGHVDDTTSDQEQQQGQHVVF